jgi:ribosomal protein S18 acetylase RimI-like enzyme
LKNTLDIIKVRTNEYNSQVRGLTSEYLRWVALKFKEEFNVDIKASISEHVDKDLMELKRYFPPYGCLLLGKYENQIVGIVRLRKNRDKIGEVKNLYVRPEFRGKGIGKMLLENLINEAKLIGYLKIRLDTGPFMKEAQELYKLVGFSEINPYPESDIIQLDALRFIRAKWIFMEMVLK